MLSDLGLIYTSPCPSLFLPTSLLPALLYDWQDFFGVTCQVTKSNVLQSLSILVSVEALVSRALWLVREASL